MDPERSEDEPRNKQRLLGEDEHRNKRRYYIKAFIYVWVCKWYNKHMSTIKRT